MSRELVPFSKNDSKISFDTDKSSSFRLGSHWLVALIIFISLGAGENTVFAITVAVNTTSDTHASSPSSSPNDGSGNVSLRSAIEYANDHSGTTVSVGSGTYNLSLGEIQIDISSSFTIIVNGAGAGSTIVKQTDGTNRVFDIDPNTVGSVNCTISSMTIENGKDGADGFGGGGIIAGQGTSSGSPTDNLTLSNCTITNNSASGGGTGTAQGGGLEMAGGNLTLTNCTFSNNTAVSNSTVSEAGAGVFYEPASVSEKLSISGCTFTGNAVNVAASGSSTEGSGLVITTTISGGTYTISNTTFSNNSFSNTGTNCGKGGAIEADGGGTPSITGCTFIGNSANGTGGAGGAIYAACNMTVTYCRFSGNASPSGSNISVTSPKTVTATNDWWASNSGSAGTTSGSGTVTATPFIKLTNTASPTMINQNSTSTITASFLTNSDGSTNSASNLGALSGLAVTWGSAVLGGVSPTSGSISNGVATTTFTAGATAGSNGSAQATVDGVTATTSPTITVDVGPSVTTQPTNQTVNAGQSTSFNAAASGSPAPTVQWQVSTDGGSTWNNIGGATSTTYSFTTSSADNGKKYRAVFTNSVSSANSNAATLTVDFAPSITTNPTNQTVNAGQSASFTAAASGNPAPTVQWQVSTDGGTTWNNVGGATSTTYSFTTASTDNGKKYRAVFTNSVSSANSNPATLTVNTGPSITTNPTNQTVNAGSSVSFTAAASGNPAPTVQWQVSTDAGTTWNNVVGATSTTYSFTTASADNGKEYRAVFTNSVSSTNSNAATLTVDFAPSITTNPTNQTVFAGDNASFTAAASGNPPPTVQWQVSTDGGTTWNSVPGATSTTLTFTTSISQNGYKYEAVFTNSVSSATSNPALLVVNDHPLAVEVSSFKAAASYNSVTLKWQTQSEVGNAGFNVLREDPGTDAFKLLSSYAGNDSLKGLGTSSTGRTYDFIDDHVASGSEYHYKIQGVSIDGFIKDFDTLTVSITAPKDYALYQNYPNPFNPSTTIRFDLKQASTVNLAVYNLIGQEVLNVDYGTMDAGEYNKVLDMSKFSSGVYFYHIAVVGNGGQRFVSTKRLMLVK